MMASLCLKTLTSSSCSCSIELKPSSFASIKRDLMNLVRSDRWSRDVPREAVPPEGWRAKESSVEILGWHTVNEPVQEG